MKDKIVTITLNPCIDKTVKVENFTVGQLNRIQDVRIDLSGKGINVSKVLNNFGIHSTACGIIAGKHGGDFLNHLKEMEIDTEFVAADGEIRTNLKIFDLASRTVTEINEPGFFVNSNTLNLFKEKIQSILPKTEIMIMSGSIPKGVDNAIYKELIEMGKNYDVKAILDADGERLKHGLEAIPYAIKPNIYELEQLIGCKFENDHQIVEAMRTFIDKGIETVIVSMGKDGAIFMYKNEIYRTKPFQIDCKSTVAAGDSMVAALVYAIKNNFSLEKTSMFATAAGTVTSSKEGSEVCNLKEVMNSYKRVIIEKY